MVSKDSIGVEEIQKLIPHRYPMLLVDKLEEVIPHESAVGIKQVTINEWFFQGHFPGNPIMPGVLIVEAMAQTAGLHVLLSTGGESKDSPVYFMAIDGAKFRRPVVPGDTLKVHVKKLKNRGPVWRYEGVARVNGDVAAEAVITAMVSNQQ